MDSIHLYSRELQFLKVYFLSIVTVTILSYSVYFFLDESTIARIGDEDHFFEWMSSLNFLLCSVIFIRLFLKKRGPLLFLLSLMFFLGFGEEISWGQRIFGFETPESLYALNMQREFNFHNTMTWEINFFYKLFTLLFGIALPFCVYYFKPIARIARKLKSPVPPISLGIFFLVDWFIFKFFLEYVLQEGFTPKYYFTLTEIYEFVSSFIMLIIAVYFFRNQSLLQEGSDIKEYLVNITMDETRQETVSLKSMILTLKSIIIPSR